MKTKLLKGISFLGLSALAVCSSIAIANAEDGETGQQCKTYTNYYLFSDVGKRKDYDDNNDNGGYKYIADNGYWEHNTSKTFNLGIPAAATNINHGMITFKQSGASGVNQMNLEDFYNKFKATNDNQTYTPDNGLTNYIRAIKWWDEGEESNSFTDFPANFSEFNVPPLSDGQYAHANVTVSDVIANRTSFDFHVTRQWYESDLDSYNNDSYTFTPAAYYIQYQLCEGTPDTPKYKATINYYYENTTTRVEFKNESNPNPFTANNLDADFTRTVTSPEAANASCTPLTPSVDVAITREENGETVTKDFTQDVFYRCSTFNATIDYYIEEKDGTVTPASKRDSSVKNYSKTGLADGANDSVKSPTIKNCKLKKNDDKTVEYTINNADFAYDVVYVCDEEEQTIINPGTGIALIITAWVVGLGALGYSAYYFMNARKEENAEL